MSRGLTTRKQHVEALIIRLRSCLSELDHWSGSFDYGDEFVGQMLDARIPLNSLIGNVERALELMPEEE